MSELTLSFDVQSFWHAGSGRGRSSILDAEVIRDEANLPYLPGKTVKGLLRKAFRVAEAIGDIPAGTTTTLFGSEVPGLRERTDDTDMSDDGNELPTNDAQDRALEKGRFSTTPGQLWFGSAELPEAWRVWAASNPRETGPMIENLFRVVASTAIDGSGMARDHTLRVVEVAVPMNLFATIIGPEDTTWTQHVTAALPYLRSIGSRASRGYGRVAVSVAKGGK